MHQSRCQTLQFKRFSRVLTLCVPGNQDAADLALYDAVVGDVPGNQYAFPPQPPLDPQRRAIIMMLIGDLNANPDRRVFLERPTAREFARNHYAQIGTGFGVEMRPLVKELLDKLKPF